uniref:Uncharacterized protein n=1 Tax=Pithovirus LCDPAC01 TaxID=2506600 RepID=A0A481YP81_9VIRU|nr:MAG: hypothetical protein LCDPAC01_02250 [Pithovirus LCDPAC01]
MSNRLKLSEDSKSLTTNKLILPLDFSPVKITGVFPVKPPSFLRPQNPCFVFGCRGVGFAYALSDQRAKKIKQ